MTIHAVIAYIKYSWSAKKLHGVHSPFVYKFSEDILYSTTRSMRTIDLKSLHLQTRYIELINKINEYYHCNENLLLTSRTEDNNSLYDLILLTDNNPGTWVQLLNTHFKNLKAESIIIVPHIHANKRSSDKWRRLHTHPKILLSMDLYGLGIIFFRKEFKEKQHFILKY